MKKYSKIVSVSLSILILISILSGCSSKTKMSSKTKLDTSKAEELNFILVGPEPKDMASVAAEINKHSQKDLNVTIKWDFLGWDNMSNKYNLILSSGEKADLIYTATWNQYQTFAKKGAFLSLDEYLPNYAPLSWKGMSNDAWKSAKINGKIYTVPCDWNELLSNGVAYRADIAKKLGITQPIKSWSELEAFLTACKKAYPDIIPFNETADGLLGGLVDQSMMTHEIAYGNSTYYAAVESMNKPKIINFLDTPDFEKLCELTNKFYNNGYWSKDILSNKNGGDALFREGRTFVCKQNITQTSALYTNCIKDHPDWEIGFFGTMDMNGGVLHTNVPIGNGVALPKACIDPARALAFVDKLRYDKDYYTLSNYGIVGKHFDLDSTGSPVFKGSSDQIGFGYQSMQPWGWHVDKMELPTTNQWPQLKPIYDKYGAKAEFNKLGAFAFDKQSVSAEDAAVNQVMNQYFKPLVAGKSTDIKGDIAKLNQNLKAAGLEKLTTELQRQLDEYWKQMGY